MIVPPMLPMPPMITIANAFSISEREVGIEAGELDREQQPGRPCERPPGRG